MTLRFEIHVSDMAAAQRFYSGLFGWSFAPMAGVPEGAYYLASGPGFAADFSLGMLLRPDTAHPAGSAIRGGTMSFAIEDCDAGYAWALENGGAEALPPTPYPGIGRVAYVEDGQGNVVGLITPMEAN